MTGEIIATAGGGRSRHACTVYCFEAVNKLQHSVERNTSETRNQKWKI
jgi:hypothetical protein